MREITVNNTLDSQTNVLRMLEMLEEIGRRLTKLESEMYNSVLWADRWAKEQCQLGLIVKSFHEHALTKAEIDDMRAFMQEFREFLK